MFNFRRRAAIAAASLWLGAGLVSADRGPMTDLEAFTALADEHNGFPHQTFRSSKIKAPVFQINSIDRERIDDQRYIFLGSVYGDMGGGPMIIDSRDFSLVYADQQYPNAYTSQVQMINGERYLTFWEGHRTRGHANGWCLVYDEQYNLKYNLSAQNIGGALADMHEFVITDDNTAIFSTYFNIPYDVSAVGGPQDSLLMDSGFQEVDIETNEVLFNWSASKHFNITDSHARYGSGFGVGDESGFDFFHINSIQKTKAGNYLICSRHLALLALIDGTDGHPIWILGGKNNQFKDLSDGRATDFSWQHDARFYRNESHITMFDNHGERTGACKEKCRSRGLHIEINEQEMTARLVKEYFHPHRVDAGAMGGFQALPNGNVLTAWGRAPAFVEFTFDGEPVMDVQRGKIGVDTQNDMFAYRVHKSDWKGRPTWPPSLAMDAPNRNTDNAKLYVSWNGATDIAKWAVFATNEPTNINKYESFVTQADRTGFETTIELGRRVGLRYVAAAAVDLNDVVLGSTVIYDMTTGRPALISAHIESVVEPQQETPTHEIGEPETSTLNPESAANEEEEEKNATSNIGSYGTIGVSVVAVAGLASLAVYLLRRRNKMRDAKEQYKPVHWED